MISVKILVDIILSNNGYEVIDLGIKVPPAELVESDQKRKTRYGWIIRLAC